MEIYEKIKEIREDKDIKAKDVAEYLKVAKNTYSQYESGKNKITAETLKKICIFLNVSADEILEINRHKTRKDIQKRLDQIIKAAEDVKKLG